MFHNLTQIWESNIVFINQMRNVFQVCFALFSIYVIWEGWMRRIRLIGSCTHSRPRPILEMDNEQGELRVKWGKRSRK